MKFREIFRFELAYQIRRPWPWLFLVALLVLSFLMARDNALADSMYEDFFVNSPFAIAKTTVFGGLIWLLLAAPIAGEAGARDVQTRMYSLTYTTSATKADYLGGRFLAALVLNALLLLGVQAGIMLAVYSPGIDAKLIGPFNIAGYLTTYAYLALPNAFVATAIQFSLATRSGRAMASYVGSLFLVFMGFFVASLLLYKRGLGTLLDPIGIRFVMEDLAHLWTPIERNTRLIALEGVVLSNRLVWIGTGIATLAATYASFRFAHRAESGRLWRRTRRLEVDSPLPAGLGVTASVPISVPTVPRTFGFGVQMRQMLAIAWTSFRTTARSLPGLGMLVFIPMLTVLVVVDQMQLAGVLMVPTTARVVGELTGPLSSELSRWVFVPLLIVFFAGELVWRERDAGMGEITDAIAGTEWPPLLGKLLGLALLLALFMATLATSGIIAQSILGYRNFEIGLYVKMLFGLQLPEYLLFTVLAVTVHVLVDEKYIGHFVAILVYVFIVILAEMLGIQHNLLVYGAGPGWTYTQMRGFGPTIAPWLWFKLYWAAWAVMLAVVARLLWVRGKERGIRLRLELARRRFKGLTVWTTGLATAFILSLGGFIFYNTNVLNHYETKTANKTRRAEYEKRYGQFEKSPQPQMTSASLRVEIYPRRRTADIKGSYRLLNGSSVAIDSIHVATATGNVETREITFDRITTVAANDAERGYRIYALEKPLQPGDSLLLNFAVHAEPRGFRENGTATSVHALGTGFRNDWLPAIGYQRSRALTSASDRREYGLEARPIVASLYSEEGTEPTARGGGISFDAVVGTEESQVGVAPGALRRSWTENGRSYFQYSTDAPIGGEWSFFSANYKVREVKWTAPAGTGRDVVVSIYHDPRHTAHLDRITKSVRASLDYNTAQFGPYPYGHLTFVEQPGAPNAGVHAEPSVFTYGEGFASWIPQEGRFDFPYAVVAHEMGHQWGLPYAFVEGAPFLSEGLAWYTAWQVVKASLGVDEFRRLMAVMRQPNPYPKIRHGEPLLRALDPYLSYRKGPFSMYALSEYVGLNAVNGAVRRQIEKHDAPNAPLATTLDLYRELQGVTPDSLKFLLHDLFEVNTYWNFVAKAVHADSTANGQWQVTLNVTARKTMTDSAGVETVLPMNEWVEIGVFGAAKPAGTELSGPLYVQKHRIRSGEQTITVTVSQKPLLAGIDPFHVLDWEEGDNDDNIEPVSIGRDTADSLKQTGRRANPSRDFAASGQFPGSTRETNQTARGGTPGRAGIRM